MPTTNGADAARIIWRLESMGADVLPDPTALYGAKAKADGWTFDDASQRWRRPGSGRAVPQSEIDKLLAARQAALKESMQGHARELAAGRINSAEFYIRMRNDIKTGHIQARLLGIGGKGKATDSDMGAIGQRLRGEYRYLSAFSAEAKGLTEAQLVQRAGLYSGSAIKDQYTAGRMASHKAAGYSQKRRTGVNDEVTCKTCREEIGRGWVGIEASGFAIGHSECMANCRCNIEFKE